MDVPFANAELVAVPEENAIRIPSGIPPKLAASIGLQGLTADFLAHDLGNNVNNSKVFVHGISGGVGQILSQLLTADGLEVYGVTSTEEKRQLALDQGAKHVFLRNTEWQETYISFFDTVYDGIGHTLAESVDLLRNRGKVIFKYGRRKSASDRLYSLVIKIKKYFDRRSVGLLDKLSRAGEKKHPTV